MPTIIAAIVISLIVLTIIGAVGFEILDVIEGTHPFFTK